MAKTPKSSLELVLESALDAKSRALDYSEPIESTLSGCYTLLKYQNQQELEEITKNARGALILAYIIGGNGVKLEEIENAYKTIFLFKLHKKTLLSYLDGFIRANLIKRENDEYIPRTA